MFQSPLLGMLSAEAEKVFSPQELFDGVQAASCSLGEVELRCYEVWQLLEAARDAVQDHCTGDIDRVTSMLQGALALLAQVAAPLETAANYIGAERPAS